MRNDYFMRKNARRGRLKQARSEKINAWNVVGLLASIGVALYMLGGIVGSFVYYVVFRLNIFHLLTINDYFVSAIDRIILVISVMFLGFLGFANDVYPLTPAEIKRGYKKFRSWTIFWPFVTSILLILIGLGWGLMNYYDCLNADERQYLLAFIVLIGLLMILLLAAVWMFGRLLWLLLIIIVIAAIQWLLSAGIHREVIDPWSIVIFLSLTMLFVVALWKAFVKRKAIPMNKRRQNDFLIMLPVIALACIAVVSLMDALHVRKGEVPVLLKCTREIDNKRLPKTIFIGASSQYNFFYHKGDKKSLGFAVPNGFVKAYIYSDTNTIIDNKELNIKGYVVVDCKYLPPSVMGQDGDI